MPVWDGPAMLAALKREMGLADANEFDDTTNLYPRASRAQIKVCRRIAGIFPNPLYPAPFSLTPSSDRKTFSWGNDGGGNAIVPMGWVQISPTVSGFSGDNFVGWQEGRDFTSEGARIRIVSNRSYGGTLYGRAVLTPPDITAVVPPAISPADACELVAVQAAWDFGLEGNQNPALANAMKVKWNDRDSGFPALMLTLKNAYRGGGCGWDPARWYFASPDLGTGNSG